MTNSTAPAKLVSGYNHLLHQIPQYLERPMGKLKISHLAEVAGVLRWSLRVEDRFFFYCTLGQDGVLMIHHEGRTERLSGCSVHAPTLGKAMRAAYALCCSEELQEALARLSVAPAS